MNKEQERNRLIELLNEVIDLPCDGELIDDIAEHLLDNGVIVPPVKVGDKVYQIDLTDSIYESEVLQIFFNTKGIAFDERAIGKTVFLTQEEAEKALKELT